MYVHKNICMQMFVTDLFVIAKTWEQSKYSPADEWLSKLCYIHKMKYYSAIKRDKSLDFIYNSINESLLYDDELKKVSQKRSMFLFV